MGGRYLEASSLEASRCFAMLAGAAYKRPRPALSEINKHIISEWCSSPLALPLSGPTRSSIEIDGFLGVISTSALKDFELFSGL